MENGVIGELTPDAGVALAEPIEIQMPEQISEGFIEIIDARSGGKLITVIEFLSMTNKIPGPSRVAYDKKIAELVEASVNVVEINLLRSGQPLPWILGVSVPRRARTTYQAMVRRAWDTEKFLYYPMPLQPRWMEVDVSGVRVEGTRHFGGPWLAMQLNGRLGLKTLLDQLMPVGREDAPWSIASRVIHLDKGKFVEAEPVH